MNSKLDFLMALVFKKNHMKKIFLLLSLLLPLHLLAQMRVVLNVPFPYPQNIEDLFQNTTMTVINPTGKTYDVYMKVSLDGLSGDAAGLHIDNFPSANKVHELISDPSTFYTFQDALNYQDQLSLKDFNLKYTPAQKNIAYDQRKLLQGSYRLCLQLFDYQTNKALSSLNGLVLGDGCQEFFITWFDPPQFNAPIVFNNKTYAEVQSNNNNQIDFLWTIDPASAARNIEYTLELRKFTTEAEMQQFENMGKPHDVFDANYTVLRNINGIMTTNYNTIDDNLDIKESDFIAARVVAKGDDIMFKNNGRSDIIIIKYANNLPKIVNVQNQNQLLQPGQFNCQSACNFNGLTPNDKVPTAFPILVNDEVRIGNFIMKITQISNNNGFFNGKGIIKVPFLWNIGINVSFNNIKINKDKRVFEGNAIAEVDNADIVNKVRNGLITNKTGLNKSDLEDMDNLINQLSRKVASNADSRTISMPLGFESNVSGTQTTLGIFGMTFTPFDANLEAATMYNIPNANDAIGLGAEICFQPQGISSGYAVLKNIIKKEVPFGGVGKMVFAPYSQVGSDTTGCFIRWHCERWSSVQIQGEFEFNNQHIVPDNNGQAMKGQNVKASFKNRFSKGNNWLAQLSFQTPFQINNDAMKGWSFEVSEAWIDQSDLENRSNMIFPREYTGNYGKGGSNDALWQGITIKRLALRGPKELSGGSGAANSGQRFSVTVDTMVFDKTGAYMSLMARNVISQGSGGAIKNWPFSLDTIMVKIVATELKRGFFSGNIALPISPKEPLYYRANMHISSFGFQFFVRPYNNNGINCSLWAANLNLERTSTIGVNIGAMPSKSVDYNMDGRIDEYDYTEGVYAKINGRITLDSKSGSVAKMVSFALPDMKIEELTLQSWGKIFDCKAISFASPEKSVNGFDASIKNVRFLTLAASQKANLFDVASDGGIRFGFEFDVNVVLAKGESNIFSATTTFAVLGRVNPSEKGWDPQFAGMNFSELDVAGEISKLVSLRGKLIVYNGHQTFGNGFKGYFGVTLKEIIQIDATVQFGNINSMDYWFVDVTGQINPGITLFAGISLRGVGGSVCYNMVPKMPDNPYAVVKTNAVSDKMTPGATSSGIFYVPKGNTFGFSLRCIVGPQTGNLYRGKMELGVTFRTDKFKIESMFFNGALEILATDDGTGPIKAEVKSLLDFANDRYHASAALYINFGDIVYGAGPDGLAGKLDIYSDLPAKRWHIWFNHPTERNGIVLLFLQFKHYMCTGNDLPPMPPIPSDILNSRALEGLSLAEFSRSMDPSTDFGLGIMFGVDFQVPDKNFEFLCFYARFGMHMGFDIAIKNIPPLPGCKEGIGINNWYAMGQAYARMMGAVGINTGIFGKVTILDLEAAAVLRAALPNPTYLAGAFGFYFSVMNGAVEGRCNFKFEVGDKPNPACAVKGSPLSGVTFIQDHRPLLGAENVDTDIIPMISLNFKINQPFTLAETDDDGKKINHTYRVNYRNFGLFEAFGDKPVEGKIILNDDLTTLFFSPNDWLKGKRQYKLKIEVFAEEIINGKWTELNIPEAKQAIDLIFKTGAAPETIAPDKITYTYPFSGQNYFMQNETNNQGTMKFWHSGIHPAISNLTNPIFNNYRTGKITARVIATIAKDTQEVKISWDGEFVNLQYPPLKNEELYCFQIIKTKNQELLASSANLTLSGHISRGQKTIMSEGAVTGSNSSNVKQNQNNITGDMKGAGVKIVYEYFFRTSKFNSLDEKFNAFQKKASPALVNHDLNLRGELMVTCAAEPFDTYDIEGFSNTNKIMPGSIYLPPLIQANTTWENQAWHIETADELIYSAYKKYKNVGVPVRNYDRNKKFEINVEGTKKALEPFIDYEPYNQDFVDMIKYGKYANGTLFYSNKLLSNDAYLALTTLLLKDASVTAIRNDYIDLQVELSDYVEKSSRPNFNGVRYADLSDEMQKTIAKTIGLNHLGEHFQNGEHKVQFFYHSPTVKRNDPNAISNLVNQVYQNINRNTISYQVYYIEPVPIIPAQPGAVAPGGTKVNPSGDSNGSAPSGVAGSNGPGAIGGISIGSSLGSILGGLGGIKKGGIIIKKFGR